jgi:serine/threonine protein kinase
MDVVPEIPGYRILDQIGQGGMATVYLAIQENLDRKVALKVMAPALVRDPSLCQRFLKEGKFVARMSSHPDIVSIYDMGCHRD